MTELADARDSLVYWELRARRLPRYAFRRRREARTLAARWERRVAEAESARYGRGLPGALAMLVMEQRVPILLQARSRRVARRAVLGMKLMALSLLAVVALAAVAMIELVAASI
jgi:hypothetical protein